MTWLLKVLGGGFGPYLLGVVAAALLAQFGTILWQRATVADLKVDVAECAGERKELKGALAVQNAEVERLARECRAQSKAADLAGLRELNKPPAPPPGIGPKEMNRWFAQRLSSR